MIHRALDTKHDWTFGKGKSNFSRGADAIKLNLKTRLLSWKGDCFFALSEGVDYNNLLDIGTKALLDQDIKRVINQSEGVLRIESFSSIINSDRGYEANITVFSTYGRIQIGV